MRDVRSKTCIFVSHCLLAQGVMAQGIVRTFPGAVRPILEYCLEHNINIVQMPCPETLCASGGLGRSPRGKAWYEQNGLRGTSRSIASGQADYMAQLVEDGFSVIAVIGVDFSPACGVTYLNQGRRVVRDQGIYTEELRSELTRRGLDVPFVGFNQRWLKKLHRDLDSLSGPDGQQPVEAAGSVGGRRTTVET